VFFSTILLVDEEFDLFLQQQAPALRCLLVLQEAFKIPAVVMLEARREDSSFF